MKRIVCLILTAVVVCAVLSGCSGSDTDKKPTAVEELEALFTTVDLMDATISDLQAEMEAGNVTSVQLTQMYIDRIEAYDEALDLNSVIQINPDALSDAAALDKERSEGTVRGALHGIPIVVKANCDVAGMATSAASNALADMVAEKDSFVVGKLKDAGAVILAQTNMSEFAYAANSSRSTLGGNAHNAYDTTRTPAGSSGGTAIAVTCNFAAAGVGTDTGGSIRNPASFANIYGIRPSKGLTSDSGVIPLKLYKDTVGPMTRTAEDMALMLENMAGADEADDYTLEADANALLGDGYTGALSADALKGMKIGYLENSFSYTYATEDTTSSVVPDEKIGTMLRKTLANLRKAGAEIVDMSEYLTTDMIKELSRDMAIDTFEYDVNKYLNDKGDAAKYKTLKEIYESGAGVLHMNLDLLVDDPASLAPSFAATVNPYTKKIGSYKRLSNWQRVIDGREKISGIMKAHGINAVMYMNFFDTAAKDQAKIDNKYNEAKYDTIFGPTFGLPEISLPMGFSAAAEGSPSGMPLGLSVFAAFGDEMTLIQISYAYEKQAGDFIRKMPEITPALEDGALAEFLSELIERAYSIDYTKYGEKPEGKVELMLAACEKAKAADTKDPYATYDAARALAEAYDGVMLALEGEG